MDITLREIRYKVDKTAPPPDGGMPSYCIHSDEYVSFVKISNFLVMKEIYCLCKKDPAS
jgi:hypothetical protein